jgi:hypothetical protein
VTRRDPGEDDDPLLPVVAVRFGGHIHEPLVDIEVAVLTTDAAIK